MELNYPTPMAVTCDKVSYMVKNLPWKEKHWFLGGNRTVAVAMKLLKEGEIIAVPTDTIYGLAGLAQNTESVERLYGLKKRDKSKPLAICLSSIKDIKLWAEIDNVPWKLIETILPGPVTIVLKRKPTLNPFFNPGFESVGIRVPTSKFVRYLAQKLNQPLALTSANLSNEPSSLEPREFSHLWPKLGGIFYTVPNKKEFNETLRVGSTIVDLTTPNKYKIIRRGIKANNIVSKLICYGLEEHEPEQI